MFAGGMENRHLVMEPAKLGRPRILGRASRAWCLSSFFFFKSSLDKDGQ